MKHLIIGGAGFIGSNLANHLLEKNEEVYILDNLSRKGSKKNLNWLKRKFKSQFGFIRADIRTDFETLCKAVKRSDRIYHLAAQVAVTTSVANPKEDFEINALGTFNVLEAARLSAKKSSILIYASTNKVYGGMENIKIKEKTTRYEYQDFPNGISEKQPLDFHSPYGCSKGCGDQYVRDYARIYGLNTIVFRQSCIYGPRQFGVEDQGWIAWFIIALTLGKQITIYGNGKQVRDILYIDDLIDAYEKAIDKIEKTRGEVFNIGGGVKNAISVWHEFGPILEKIFARKIKVKYDKWRPGDQKVYISDISKAKEIFSWQPHCDPKSGIKQLYEWVQKNKHLFAG